MYNEVCCEKDCVPSPADGMKQTIMILHDEVKKTREMAFEIMVELFGGKPQEINSPDIQCAQDALNECRNISDQNVAILYDILQKIRG